MRDKIEPKKIKTKIKNFYVNVKGKKKVFLPK